MTSRLATGVAESDDEYGLLEEWAQEGAHSAMTMRATIVLLARAGVSRSEIARRLNVSRPTVIMWIRRFEREGVAGLHDRARTGRRRTLQDSEVVLETLTASPGGSPYQHWSSRSLAAKLEVSNGTIARIWRRWHLQPAYRTGYRLPTTPVIDGRIADVVGLYCDTESALLIVRSEKRPRRSDISRPTRVTANNGSAQLRDVLTSPDTIAEHLVVSQANDVLRAMLGQLTTCYSAAHLHGILATDSPGRDQGIHLPERKWRLCTHMVPAECDWIDAAVVAIGIATHRYMGDIPEGSPALWHATLAEIQRRTRVTSARFCWVQH